MTPSTADPFDVGVFTRWMPASASARPRWSIRRRALTAAAVAWFPLVLLTAAQGTLLPPRRHESILLDITVYARYLVAVPLFVAAEAVTLPPLGVIARHFLNGGIVAARHRDAYEAVTASVRRLLAHRLVAPALVVVAFAGSAYRMGYAPEHGGLLVPRRESWFAVVVDGERAITLAGWWLVLVSQPLFLFLAGLWLWRLTGWIRFLWGVSRLELRLVAAHPDRAGGLTFVSGSLRAFAFVAIGFSAAFAGVIAEEVIEFGRTTEAFYYIVLGATTAVVLTFVAPLFIFFGVLRRLRLRGPVAYSGLAATVGRLFEARWLHPSAPVEEALSRTDFSAMTDLYSITANTQRIRLVPIAFAPLAILTLGAFLPYLLVALVTLPIDRLLAVVKALLL